MLFECEREMSVKMCSNTCHYFNVLNSLLCESRHKILKSFIPCIYFGAVSTRFGSESDCSGTIDSAPSLERKEVCSVNCGYKAKRVLSIENTATQNRFLFYCLTKRVGGGR
jgi:hypothetical protein